MFKCLYIQPELEAFLREFLGANTELRVHVVPLPGSGVRREEMVTLALHPHLVSGSGITS